MREILTASRRVQQAGLLYPDVDPGVDFDSIRQWPIWSVEQQFDLASFTDAFVEHTRKNLEAAGRQWDDGFADTLAGPAAHRWNDIVRVLEAAGQRQRKP